MASATVGILRVLLTANTAEFDAAMKKASESAKVWSRDLNRIGQQATAVGQTLTKAITLPLLGLGAGAIKMASDFESSFAGVRKTVDATEPEFAQLAQGLRNMAKEIPVNVNELNKVAEAAGQLGIKKDDILQFTRTMADLGVTTNLTADEAATATAQIQNIFGAAGKDVDRFGATLVALGNAGASTEKDIISMGLRIAGAGNQVGLSQAQVLAFASALSSVGINAEAGGSAISRVFLKINDAVAVGGGAMQEFARVAGMSGAAFKQAWETDAAGATTAFISGLARLKGEGENVNATLENLVGKNIILKDTLLRASGAGSLLTEQLALGNRAWQENSALVKEAEQRYKTFESQAKLLWAQLRDVGITLGNALIPILRDLMTALQPVISAVATAADWFAKLPQPVRVTMVAIAALAAAIGPLLWAFGQIATGVATIIGAFTAKGIATRALTAIMTTATAQTGLFGMALGALGTASAVAATAFAAWHLGGWIGEITGATDAVGRLSAKFGEFIGLLPKGTAAQYDASRAAVAAADSARNMGGSLTQATAVAKATEQQSTALAAALANVSGQAGATVPSLGRFGKATEDAGKKAKDATKELREFNNWLGERQMEAAGVLIAAMDSVAASFQKGLSTLVAFRESARSTADEMRELGASIHDLVSSSIADFAAASTAARKAAQDWANINGAVLAPSIKAVGTTIDTETPTWRDKFTSVGQHISQVFANAFTGGGGALGAIKTLATEGLSALMGMIPGIGPFIQGFAGPIIAMLGRLTRRFADFFRNIFGGPSRDEIEGRELVAGFEDALHSTLTASQEAESQGEDWRRTVIAIRDAYIAMGRTEEEALRDAERLWESSRQGAEESAKVIEEIQRKMRELTSQTHEVDVEITYRTNAPPGAQLPGEPEQHTQPVPFDPGFATGTMGRFGTFFRDFGKGFPTTLHGVEAVLRPQDVMPFASAVMSGVGATSSATTTNNILVTIPPEATGDPLRMSDHVLGQIPSAVELDRFDLLQMLEAVVDNRLRDRFGLG